MICGKVKAIFIASMLAGSPAPAVEMVVMAPDVNDDRQQLPFSQGKAFATLDGYLAHRERLGAMDVPYYRLRKDGLYELTGGRRRPGSPVQTFTRQELLEKFGFRD